MRGTGDVDSGSFIHGKNEIKDKNTCGLRKLGFGEEQELRTNTIKNSLINAMMNVVEDIL